MSMRITWEDLGTAFFVNEGGLFVTAAHVVPQGMNSDPPLAILYPALNNTIFVTLRPRQLAVHPTLDVAIGLARVPQEVELQRLRCADDEMPAGEQMLAFGYSHSTFVDHEPQTQLLGGTGLWGLSAHIVNAFHCGQVSDYYPNGVGWLKGQPLFTHTAQTIGAQSGGPVFSVTDGLVYGISSRGSEGHGMAIDIRALLDWPIPFLGGLTLRYLSQWELITLEKRDRHVRPIAVPKTCWSPNFETR